MTLWIAILVAASLSSLQTPPEAKSTSERAIAEVERRFEIALEKRDRAELESVLADPFTWIHAQEGRVESRSVFIDNAVRGMGLARQYTQSATFERTLDIYGDSAIATSRVRNRFPDGGREVWFRQSRVYVREGSTWKFAMGHGTVMYDGPVTRGDLYARYAGTYAIPDGRILRMDWDGDSLIATFPGGTRSQVFLKSPTEEAIASPNRFLFTLDSTGRPTTVHMMRGTSEAWRAERKQ
jgi:ketosteroid isomerase-like protein